jgi:predicted nucleic-acid-binding Zn-ribbon protein
MEEYKKFHILWSCPKCGERSPDVKWDAAKIFGGDKFLLHVTCWKCGYYEMNYTRDYDSDTT